MCERLRAELQAGLRSERSITAVSHEKVVTIVVGPIGRGIHSDCSMKSGQKQLGIESTDANSWMR